MRPGITDQSVTDPAMAGRIAKARVEKITRFAVAANRGGLTKQQLRSYLQLADRRYLHRVITELTEAGEITAVADGRFAPSEGLCDELAAERERNRVGLPIRAPNPAGVAPGRPGRSETAPDTLEPSNAATDRHVEAGTVIPGPATIGELAR